MKKQLALLGSLVLLSTSSFAIHGGRDAKVGELPSTVGFVVQDSPGHFRTFCSGTLIDAQTVLTAAHCHGEPGADAAYVVFSLDANGADVVALPVSKWIVHEKWSEDSVEEMDPRDTHDIALAKFSGVMPETHRVAEILAEDSFVKRGTQILVAGYGYNDESMEPGPDGWPKMPTGAGVLRSTRVRVSDAQFSVTEVLTIEVKSGTNSADSGGSAFVRRGPKYYLWGVTSRGLPGQDGVYTRINSYLDWILLNLQSSK